MDSGATTPATSHVSALLRIKRRTPSMRGGLAGTCLAAFRLHAIAGKALRCQAERVARRVRWSRA